MMTQNERNEIGITLVNMSTYYGKTIDKNVIKMMVQDLEDLEFLDVINAFTSYRRNPANIHFPLPAKIRAIVNPKQSPDALANESASRIRKAISDFGWNNSQQARDFIGELGWKVVERSGGWMHVCENHGLSLSPLVFHAQARDLAKAICESEILGIGDQPIQLPNKSQNEQITSFVAQLSEAKKLIT